MKWSYIGCIQCFSLMKKVARWITKLLFIWSPTSKQHSRTSTMLLVTLKKNQWSPLCWWPVDSEGGCQRGKGAVRSPALWCVNLGPAAASFQAGSETCPGEQGFCRHEPWSLAHPLVCLSLMFVPACLLIPYPAVLFLLFCWQSTPAATSTSVALTDYISMGYLCNMA